MEKSFLIFTFPLTKFGESKQLFPFRSSNSHRFPLLLVFITRFSFQKILRIDYISTLYVMTNHHILNQNEVKKLLKYKLIEKTTFTTRIKILCHDFCQMGRGECPSVWDLIEQGYLWKPKYYFVTHPRVRRGRHYLPNFVKETHSIHY